MSLRKRVVAFAAGVALIIAVAGASAGVTDTLTSLSASSAPAIACNGGASSGGGC